MRETSSLTGDETILVVRSSTRSSGASDAATPAAVQQVPRRIPLDMDGVVHGGSNGRRRVSRDHVTLTDEALVVAANRHPTMNSSTLDGNGDSLDHLHPHPHPPHHEDDLVVDRILF